jgi:hypothetical protein
MFSGRIKSLKPRVEREHVSLKDLKERDGWGGCRDQTKIDTE